MTWAWLGQTLVELTQRLLADYKGLARRSTMTRRGHSVSPSSHHNRAGSLREADLSDIIPARSY